MCDMLPTVLLVDRHSKTEIIKHRNVLSAVVGGKLLAARRTLHTAITGYCRLQF